MVLADDWGRYASSYAALDPGGPSDVVRTPHFDRVAREGVLFTNAFVNAPSCTPSRSALLSGQHFWRTGRGAILSGAVWDPAIPSYPLILESRGYHVGFSYKVWSPGQPTDAPYGGAARAYVKHGVRFDRFSEHVSAAQDPAAAKAELLAEVRNNFRDFLAAREAGRPFAYWLGPTNTHRPWARGSGKAVWGIDPDWLRGKLPADVPDVPAVREDVADYLGEVQALDAALGVLLDELDRAGVSDDTLLAVSGDHGIPGVPRGKCNLYDLGVAVSLAIRWPRRVPAGRVVSDFVSVPDLAPTFLEAAGVTPPPVMTARSLMPVLTSRKQGRVDASRDFVVFGRERHVAAARTGALPYPHRGIRTDGYLYIRNFAPDRWPAGTAPGYGRPDSSMPSPELLRNDHAVAFPDVDRSPTKAWLVTNRDDPAAAPYFQRGLGLRPAEELYELRRDRYQLHNVAGDPAYEAARLALSARLMAILERTGDPRVTETHVRFERPPYAGTPPAVEKRRPNIVLIAADDLGYGETGMQGNREIDTPHIDALAAGGVRFTSGYVTAPVCSPSRAGLLTGRYQQRFGHELNILGPNHEQPHVGLPLSETTLPERLRAAGYRTGMVGKWHLGSVPPFHPQRRGFDEFFGYIREGHFYVGPRAAAHHDHLRSDEPTYDQENPVLRGSEPVEEPDYLTDAFTREALAFIDRHRREPFFLYLAHSAVHSPMQAVSPYWDRFARITDPHRRTFAAMLAALDASVGAVMGRLRALGLERDSIVAFVSDNGGPTAELTSSNRPLRGGKGNLYEGGVRVPMLLRWPAALPGGLAYDRPVTALDLVPTFLRAAGLPVGGGAALDGVDLVPFLTGRAPGDPHEHLYWRYGRRHAIRRGRWKMVVQGSASPELYDLKRDLGESSDRAAENPDVVRALEAALAVWTAQLRNPSWGDSAPAPPHPGP